MRRFFRDAPCNPVAFLIVMHYLVNIKYFFCNFFSYGFGCLLTCIAYYFTQLFPVALSFIHSLARNIVLAIDINCGLVPNFCFL